MDPSLEALFWWLSALIALPTVAYAGQPFFASAASALRARRLNMDVPISLAILLATAMSLYQTMRGNEQVYFDAAVTLLFFLLVGRFLDESLARPRPRRGAEPREPAERHGHAHRGDGCTALRAGACARSRRPSARRRRRACRGRRRDLAEGTGEIDQSLITGETVPATVNARRNDLCRHAQFDAARSRSRSPPPIAQRCSPRSGA